MATRNTLPDGIDELREDIPLIAELVARTARWVHPDTFTSLPIWYPETARGRANYDAGWRVVYENRNRETGEVASKKEGNVRAGKALVAALGVAKSLNWTVCHIWGVDDPSFQKSNRVVRDPRYYSCVANMVWLPTPLKGFTDAMPEIKQMLRYCALHLYGWACEHPDVSIEASAVRSSKEPLHYPGQWPTQERRGLPPGTLPCSQIVQKNIARRKADLRRMLADERLVHFPREEVLGVLDYWKVDLNQPR